MHIKLEINEIILQEIKFSISRKYFGILAFSAMVSNVIRVELYILWFWKTGAKFTKLNQLTLKYTARYRVDALQSLSLFKYFK